MHSEPETGGHPATGDHTAGGTSRRGAEPWSDRTQKKRDGKRSGASFGQARRTVPAPHGRLAKPDDTRPPANPGEGGENVELPARTPPQNVVLFFFLLAVYQ